MKKRSRFLLIMSTVVAIAVLSVIVLTGCGLTDEEKEVVGKYNLTSVSGLAGVSASAYDYNYVELLSNKNYKLANKYSGIVTEQTGKWAYADGEVTFTIKSGTTSVKETYKLSNGVLTISATLEGKTITMVYNKEVTETAD